MRSISGVLGLERFVLADEQFIISRPLVAIAGGTSSMPVPPPHSPPSTNGDNRGNDLATDDTSTSEALMQVE
jgi:hypothetical protein